MGIQVFDVFGLAKIVAALVAELALRRIGLPAMIRGALPVSAAHHHLA